MSVEIKQDVANGQFDLLNGYADFYRGMAAVLGVRNPEALRDLRIGNVFNLASARVALLNGVQSDDPTQKSNLALVDQLTKRFLAAELGNHQNGHPDQEVINSMQGYLNK